MLLLLAGVYCCLFNDKWIVSGGGDGLVIVWDTTTGLHRLTLSGHTEEIVRKWETKSRYPLEGHFIPLYTDTT